MAFRGISNRKLHAGPLQIVLFFYSLSQALPDAAFLSYLASSPNLLSTNRLASIAIKNRMAIPLNAAITIPIVTPLLVYVPEVSLGRTLALFVSL